MTEISSVAKSGCSTDDSEGGGKLWKKVKLAGNAQKEQHRQREGRPWVTIREARQPGAGLGLELLQQRRRDCRRAFGRRADRRKLPFGRFQASR